MGRGYDYRYRVCVLASREERKGNPACGGRRTYILKVRTKFILKPISGEKTVMGTEIFSNWQPVDDDKVENHTRIRLSEYRMPRSQIRAAAQAVLDTIHDPRHKSFHTTNLGLSVKVYTVQLEGEPLDATIDRLVKPDMLTHLKVLRWWWSAPCADLQLYLRGLPVVVVDVDEMDLCPVCLKDNNKRNGNYHQEHSVGRKEGMDLMESCPICLREPIVGAKIASLPCKHAFHDHCIFRWLFESNKSCPMCRVEIQYI